MPTLKIWEIEEFAEILGRQGTQKEKCKVKKKKKSSKYRRLSKSGSALT